MGEDEVFLDSASLIALVHGKDKYHHNALETTRLLSEQHRQLVTTDLVLVETANFLKRRHLHHLAVAALERALRLRDSGALIPIFVDEHLFSRGWQLMANRPDKDWELTDCISFVVMQDRGITTAFTTDRHFEQAGFRALLRR